MKRKAKGRVVHAFIDKEFVRRRIARSAGMGYLTPPKWLQFCQKMLEVGYTLQLYEAPATFSKYVTVYGPYDLKFKVRFSDHKPIKRREIAGDCDFFVGITHTGTRTTDMAITAVQEYFFNAV